jgi:hypothetical protein
MDTLASEPFSFPKRSRGRPTREEAALYQVAVARLVEEILKIRSTPELDFKVSRKLPPTFRTSH